MWKEFKDFALKGNVIDMAIGVVIGTAFKDVVKSLVGDIVMPPIGILTGGVDFSELVITLKGASSGVGAVTINYGVFLNTLIDFFLIAIVIFIITKKLSKFPQIIPGRSNVSDAKPTEAKKGVSKGNKEEVLLLKEIRDLLKKEGGK